jgi:hypothetical protein
MMSKGARAGLVLIGAMALVGGAAESGLAQTKDLSEKSVLSLMRYAWAMVPQKFTTPQGKVIEVDKSKPSDTVVPIDTAREVIRVGRMSAYAQLCELPEEQRANYQTLMRREEGKKWTDQQLLYINQLHLFTVMTLTGKVQLVEKDGDKQVVVQEGKAAKTESCTDTERKKIQQQIMAYVGSAAPPAAPAATSAPAKTAPPPPKAAAPTRASEKK